MKDNVTKFILDIGNSKIRMLAGELSEHGKKLKVLKYIEVPSKGIKKNIIENKISLSERIADVSAQMQEALGYEIDKVVLGIGGTNIYSRTKNMKLVFDKEKIITEADINKMLSDVEEDLKNGNEKVLTTEIYNIKINNSGIVKDPIGLLGREIQADIHLIFINKIDVEELTEVVNRAKLEVESVVLNSYASAKSTLTEIDKKMGVALIDIGEGTTDIVIYKNNKLIYANSLPLGGMHYVSDLKILFKILPQDAEKIIKGLNQVENSETHKFLISGNKYVLHPKVKKVIDARTGDIVKYVKKAIDESGFTGYLGKGIYLTGGTVMIDEVFEGIRSNLGYSVKRVLPIKILGLENVEYGMSTIIGIFVDVMEKEYKKIEKERIKREEQENKLKENIKIKVSSEENKNEKENDTEEKPVKESKFESIKKWFSNFV